MGDGTMSDFWSQLTSSTGATRSGVLIAAYAVERPVAHPLGWLAFDVWHEKLRQPGRMIVLPADRSSSPSGLDSPRPNGAEETVVDPAVLERVRAVAGLNDVDLPRVVDLEPWQGRMVVLVPRSVGIRLSAAACQQAWSGEQWHKRLREMASQIEKLHSAGVCLLRWDPLLWTYEETQDQVRLDDLVSSPWIDDTFFPDGLADGERQWLQDFRRRRSEWWSTYGPGLGPLEPVARDWLEYATCLDFLADSYAQDLGSQVSVQHWRVAVDDLLACVRTGGSVPDWSRRWFGHDSSLERRVSVEARSEVRVAEPDAATHVPTISPSTVPPLATRKQAPMTVADRHETKRQAERRKRLIIGFAVALPFPVFLIGFLLVYFLWPSGDRLPNIALNQPTDELPTVELPLDTASLQATSQRNSPTDATRSLDSAGGDSRDSAGVADLDPRPRTADELSDADDDELLQDLMGGDTESQLREWPPAIDASTGVDSSTSAGPVTEAGLATETAAGKKPDGESLPDLDFNLAAMVEPASSQLDNRPTELATRDTIDLDGEFIEYLSVVSESDVLGLWQQQLANSESPPQWPVVVSLGQVNWVTAEHTAAKFVMADSGLALPVELRRQLVVRNPVIQGWEIVEVGSENAEPIALLQANRDGRLELLLWPTRASLLARLVGLRLQLGYRDSISHEIALSRGSQPELVDRPAAGDDPAIVSQRPGSQVAGAGWEDSGGPAAGETRDEIPNLVFDPRTAVSKAWVKDTPGGLGENLEWRFQLDGRPLCPLEKENPVWLALKVRSKDQPYVVDERFDTGSLIFTVSAESGTRTRLQGRLQFLTPSGLRPLKRGAAAEASQEAFQFQQGLKAQYEVLDGTRAKPGEGDRKRAELNRLEAMIREIDRYREALKFAIENEDSLLTQGVAFQLVEPGADGARVVLRSSGFRDTIDGGPPGNLP